MKSAGYIFLVFTALIAFGVQASAAMREYKATLLHSANSYFSTFAAGVSESVQVGNGHGAATVGYLHALLWNGSADSVVDLSPAGVLFSSAYAIDGNIQVGAGSVIADNLRDHALKWQGTAASVVDLHPAGFISSTAVGVSGNSQVGSAFLTKLSSGSRAMLWHGTAVSAVNLHPAGFASSAALGVDGNTQVGYALTADGLSPRAIMWQGSADNLTNLHPAKGYRESWLEDVSGNTQVGFATTDATISSAHAMLWHAAADSFVDLHPDGYSTSVALAVAGDQQVGHGFSTDLVNNHALVWKGTAASVVDLHSTLADTSIDFVSSEAYDVDANGSIVGIARDINQNSYAILWTPVPEPTTGLLVVLGMCGGLVSARRRGSRWPLKALTRSLCRGEHLEDPLRHGFAPSEWWPRIGY